MDIEKVQILSDIMREHNLTGDDLNDMARYYKTYQGVPVISDGAQMPLELRYSDKTVSNMFLHFKAVKAVHLDGIDVSLTEASVPMNYENALVYCRQIGGRMMNTSQALLIYAQFKNLNDVLKKICAEPLREYLYWVEDRGSKAHLKKVIDFRTGEIKEVRKYDSFRVRPIGLF